MLREINLKLTPKSNTFGAATWSVRSPEIPGLLVVHADTIPEALMTAANEINNLALAYAMEAAHGADVVSIFPNMAE